MEKILEIQFDGGKGFSAVFPEDGHRIPSDQSPANGGRGAAPEPFQLLLAGLASCAAIYMQGYGERKGLQIDWSNIRLELSGQWNPTLRLYEKITFQVISTSSLKEEMQELIHTAIMRSAVLRQVRHNCSYEVQFQS